LHTRTIVRDSDRIFLGSQSLRATELDQRREVGLIFRDARIAGRLAQLFDEDWEAAEPVEMKQDAPAPVAKVAKKLAKKVVKQLPPVAPVLEQVAGKDLAVDRKKIEERVKAAVKEAVKEAVEDAVETR